MKVAHTAAELHDHWPMDLALGLEKTWVAVLKDDGNFLAKADCARQGVKAALADEQCEEQSTKELRRVDKDIERVVNAANGLLKSLERLKDAEAALELARSFASQQEQT